LKYNGYIDWKNWDESEFGFVKPGSRFYFNQMFRNRFNKKSKILEIGFGNGELLSYFSKLGHQVIGVEINNDLVQRAKSSGYNAYAGIISKIPELQSEKFDLIVGTAVAEHMHHEDLIQLFSWANTHLNDGGTLHLVFPEGASPLALGYQNGDFTHLSCLTKSKVKALCQVSNMTLISYKDERLVSNKLCSFGSIGKIILIFIQLYSYLLKLLIKALLFPLCPKLKLSTNSVAVISASK
jgi:SAM-dependent methyltransferase